MAINVSDQNFQKEVLESKIPVLVDFWAPWCGPCRMVAPVVEEIEKDYEGKIKVCKVNVDEAGSAAEKYNVMSIPTLALFKDGEVATQTIGAQPKSQFQSMIKPYI